MTRTASVFDALQLAGHVEAERLVIDAMRAQQLAVEIDLGLPVHAVEAQPQPPARGRRLGGERRAVPADRVGGGLCSSTSTLVRVRCRVVALAGPVAPLRHRGRLPLRIVEIGRVPRRRRRNAFRLGRLLRLEGESSIRRAAASARGPATVAATTAGRARSDCPIRRSECRVPPWWPMPQTVVHRCRLPHSPEVKTMRSIPLDDQDNQPRIHRGSLR